MLAMGFPRNAYPPKFRYQIELVGADIRDGFDGPFPPDVLAIVQRNMNEDTCQACEREPVCTPICTPICGRT